MRRGFHASHRTVRVSGPLWSEPADLRKVSGSVLRGRSQEASKLTTAIGVDELRLVDCDALLRRRFSEPHIESRRPTAQHARLDLYVPSPKATNEEEMIRANPGARNGFYSGLVP